MFLITRLLLSCRRKDTCLGLSGFDTFGTNFSPFHVSYCIRGKRNIVL